MGETHDTNQHEDESAQTRTGCGLGTTTPHPTLTVL